MLTRVRSRGRVRALAFGLLVACPLAAVAYPVVPQPQFYDGSRGEPVDYALRAAKRRNAPPVPFDLTYLPAHASNWNGPRGVVAVRPCAVFDRPGGDRLARSFFVENGLLEFIKGFLGLQGLALPAPRELDMVLARVETNIVPAADGKHDSFNACVNSFVLRTRDRFNWKRAVAAMPDAPEARTRRGFEYHAVEVATGLPVAVKGGPVLMGLFVADARTLVIDTEDFLKVLLDRLADGKPAEQPAGWEKVSRGVLAVALANPDKRWTRDLPGAEGPRLPKGGDWEYNVLDDLDELVVGLDDRPTTRFYLAATARDPFAGKRMAWNARKLLALAETHLGGEKEPPADVVRALWAKGRFAPTLRGFEITADAGTDLLGPLLDRLMPPPVEFVRPPGGRNTLGSF